MTAADVLAVAAHPDDVELGCGGTLIKLKSNGFQTAIVDVSRGELGSRGNADIRAREAERAAAILQVAFRENLGLPDGDIVASPENRLKLIRILREVRPRLVLTHLKGMHPDHQKVRTLVEEACHHAGLARIDTGQERYRPERIAYWIEFRESVLPQVVVDISQEFEMKQEAIEAFESQLHGASSKRDPETYLSRHDFLDQLRSHHRQMGNMSGCTLGEGFRLSRLPRLQNLMDW